MYKKLYVWSISLTAIASFIIWHLVSLIKDISWMNNYFQIIIEFTIGVVFTFGFFKGIVSLFCWLIEKCKCIKKLFFADSYIEGIWIGFSISSENKIVLVIQKIEQTPHEISIHGQTFKYNNGNPIHHNLWSSTGASFDNVKHILNFTYISNKMEKVNEGFCSYQFINQGKKAPNVFFGYIGNYTLNGKIVSMCKRYPDLKNIPDLKELVIDAKRFYEDHKELFDHQDS